MTTKENAMSWLDREIGYLMAAPQLNGCPMTQEWQEQVDIFSLCRDLLRKEINNERN